MLSPSRYLVHLYLQVSLDQTDVSFKDETTIQNAVFSSRMPLEVKIGNFEKNPAMNHTPDKLLGGELKL